jgi:hypothetical protein
MALSLLKSSDTLYVELKKISHFVKYTLPKITVDVVLISGQNHLVPQKPQKLDYVWSQDDFDAIVNNPYITHWFMMNMDVYAQDPDHVKVRRVRACRFRVELTLWLLLSRTVYSPQISTLALSFTHFHTALVQ